ncbi:MAG: GNAT family N-acetyltransferase [Roseimicrobium sp.]
MTTRSPYLRLATRDDASSLLRLIIELAEFERLTPPGAEAQARRCEDAFGATPRFEAWLAFVEEEPEPVGYAIFLETYSSFLARPTLYIEDVFVQQDFRKQGIGRALLHKAVQLAYERGCGRVEWTALDWNVHAQRVYEENMGARRMEEWLLYRMTSEDMVAFLDRSAKRHTSDSGPPLRQS